MQVDVAIRAIIQQEIARALEPLQAALAELQAGPGAVLQQLTALLSQQKGRTAPSVTRRPRAARRVSSRRVRAENGANERGCAIAGCKRPARSKGYCMVHYQKLRRLTASKRRPVAWQEFAPANSVADLVLPRGRKPSKQRVTEGR